MAEDVINERLIQLGENTPLLYGSTISLSPYLLKNFVLFTDGLSNKNVNLKDFTHHDSKVTFRRCLFRIYPKFNNLFTAQAIDIKNKLQDEKSDVMRRIKIESIRENVVQEYKQNLQAFKKVQNSPILFDTSV